MSVVFANDALLLIGHGSARYPDAGRVLCDQACRIRAAGSFREVAMGLLNGAPAAAESLTRLTAPVVRLVPFFMEDGYFSRNAVPRAVGLANTAGRVMLSPAIGLHKAMADLILDRALDGCAQRGLEPRAAAVLVVGHGSARAPGRALALHRHAARVAAAGAFATVAAACLEEPPFVANVLRELRERVVVVVGFFAGEGGHVRDDLPKLLAAERLERGVTGLQVLNLGCVTDTPSMMQIILEQAAT